MSFAVSSTKQTKRPGSSKNPPPTHDKKKDTAVAKSVSELQKENDALKYRIECLEKEFDPKVFEKKSEPQTYALFEDALKSAEETIVKLRNGNSSNENTGELNKAKVEIKELTNKLNQKAKAEETLKLDLQTAQSERDDLKKQLTEARSNINSLNREKQEKDITIKTKEEEIKRLRNNILSNLAKFNNKDTEIASLKKHVEELKTTTNQSSGSIDTKTLQKQLEQNKQEIDRLSSELGGVKKNLEIKKEEVLSLKDEKKAIESMLTTLKSISESQKNSSKTNTEMQDKIESMEKKINDKDTEIGKKTSEIDGLKNEIADLKKSLSRPDIQDLSDSNRPSKLAERLFELYDNEWTNCYETVRKQFSTEQSAVQMLLRTCVKIYNSCTLIATSNVHDLQCAFSTFSEEKDDVLLIQIKQRRKRARRVDIDLKRITQGIGDNVADILGPDLIRNLHVRAFWVKCLEICWLMVIQDPPVYMDIEIDKQGQMFDHAAYRPYTQTGYEFDYVVWPALYTHQGGDILHKGVAQGRESSDSVGGKRRGILVKN
ncbi:tax1-binding protein 1 homolog isoform X11 [Dreissena polymorpha]|uniref:tax1-binding protein 1 homolog isoform X11 n=1 Tax=Dreissena polymorpha TaxID=45954 RepID=UPI002264CBDB|nr:tax1-binding protein 1 homolog isoform X11 [Dreissena polymorpha]